MNNYIQPCHYLQAMYSLKVVCQLYVKNYSIQLNLHNSFLDKNLQTYTVCVQRSLRQIHPQEHHLSKYIYS